MANLDTTALSAVLKQQYTQSKVYDLCYKKRPAWAMLKKNTDFVGSNKVVAVRNAMPQGRSHTFATGQSNVTPSTYNKFTVTRRADYAFAEITTEAILAAKNDAGALLRSLKKEVDGAIETSARNIAVELFRNGGGARGQISSTSNTGTATITLTVPADVVNFEIGMVLQTSTADGTSGSVKAGTVTLTAIDRTAGTLTASGNWTAGIATAAANDYIFQAGDFGAGVKGFPAWIPATAPTSGDNFFGLDRSSDVVRLAGIRYNGSGAPIEETLIAAAALAGREGASPDVVFMNPLDYSNLVTALGSKVIYERMKVSGTTDPNFGFQTVTLVGPTGPVGVVSDVNCQKGTAFMLQMDTWSFDSLEDAPMILDQDGLQILRKATSDSYEVRVGYFGQLICEAPNYNVNITL